MHRWFWLVALLAASALYAQNPGVVIVGTAPSGPCPKGVPGRLVNSTGHVWTCQHITAGMGTWTDATGGGGSGTVTTTGTPSSGQTAVFSGATSITGGGPSPAFTCNPVAYGLADYAAAVCTGTFTAANLNSFDGTVGTALPAISAPGSGKMVQPSAITMQYVAGSHPFGAGATWNEAYDSLSLSPIIPFTLDTTAIANKFSSQVGLSLLISVDPTALNDTAFSFFLTAPISGGAIATSSVTSGGGGHLYAPTDTFSINGGNGDAVGTVTSVDAGDGAIVAVNPTPDAAGLGYAANDTGTLTHGTSHAAYLVDSLTTTGGIGSQTASYGCKFAVSDAGYVQNGATNDGTYEVATIDSEAIVAVDQSNKSFEFSGWDTNFCGFASGQSCSITVSGSTGNDGVYALAGCVQDGSNTKLTTTDSIPDSTADGHLSIGALASVTIPNPGSNYQITRASTITTTGSGVNGLVNIESLLLGVATFHLTSYGTGYSVENNSPTATGGGQPGVGTGFKVNITDVNVGIVTGFTVSPDGTNYTTGPGVGTSVLTGSGDGMLTVGINSITQGNGHVNYSVPYMVVPIV